MCERRCEINLIKLIPPPPLPTPSQPFTLRSPTSVVVRITFIIIVMTMIVIGIVIFWAPGVSAVFLLLLASGVSLFFPSS